MSSLLIQEESMINLSEIETLQNSNGDSLSKIVKEIKPKKLNKVKINKKNKEMFSVKSNLNGKSISLMKVVKKKRNPEDDNHQNKEDCNSNENVPQEISSDNLSDPLSGDKKDSLKPARRSKYRTKKELSTFGVEFLGFDGDTNPDSETFAKMFACRPLSDNRYECTLCFKILKITSLKQHALTHIGIKPFRCSYCGQRYTRKADAMRHVQNKHTNASDKCTVCGKAFTNVDALLQHLERHKKKPAIHRCHICSHKFKNKLYYKNHMHFIHSIDANSLAFNAATKAQSQIQKLTLKPDKYLMNYDPQQVEADITCENSDCDSPSEAIEPFDCVKHEIESENLGLDTLKDPHEHSRLNINHENLNSSIYEKELTNAVSEEVVLPTSKLPSLSDQITIGYHTTIDKGNAILTQKLVKTESIQEEREIVNKAIEVTASQSQSTLAHILSSTGNNFSSTPIQQYFRAVNSDDSKDEPLKSNSPTSEVHISATIRNRLRKFIIKIPSSSMTVMDPLTHEGQDTLRKMVNHFCSGRGNIDGLIEVSIHHPHNQEIPAPIVS